VKSCPACHRAHAHGLLCHHCTTTLENDLRDVPHVVRELDTTLAKQGRNGPETGGLAHERTGYHTGASTAATRLRDHINDLRAHPDADKLHAEVTHAVSEARRATDQPANRAVINVGPCPDCDGHVYAFIPTEDARPARMECRANPDHRWDATQWIRAGRRILARMAELRRARA
jgi:hypothetical protein